MNDTTRADFFEYLLRLSDDRLVLGHRISEWCGHAPILEEDIALANISLDLIGQATLILQLAGETEGKGRDQDALAYLRDAIAYRNALLLELPNGDFAVTTMRLFLFSAFATLVLERLQKSADATLAGIAAKAYKEARYHLRHSGEWVIRLGDGTDESHRRMQDALDGLWRYTGELFETDDLEKRLVAAGLAVDSASLLETWTAQVRDVLTTATLTVPAPAIWQRGGRSGKHTEHLGHMLAEMQIVARSYPGAKW